MTAIACLDHLVVVAPDLDTGRAWAEHRLGQPPAGAGRHARMGTHNLLWGLGDVYLEVIAVDPDGTRPERPRWFGLDHPDVSNHLREGPWLATWAVATDQLESLIAEAPVPHTDPQDFARNDLTWQVALPEGAALPLGGAWPLMIRWQTGLHPAKRLGEQGLRLGALEIAGEGAEAAGKVFGTVAAPRPVTFRPDGGPTRLSATILTDRGEVEL
jgi:hypothetical protein